MPLEGQEADYPAEESITGQAFMQAWTDDLGDVYDWGQFHATEPRDKLVVQIAYAQGADGADGCDTDDRILQSICGFLGRVFVLVNMWKRWHTAVEPPRPPGHEEAPVLAAGAPADSSFHPFAEPSAAYVPPTPNSNRSNLWSSMVSTPMASTPTSYRYPPTPASRPHSPGAFAPELQPTPSSRTGRKSPPLSVVPFAMEHRMQKLHSTWEARKGQQEADREQRQQQQQQQQLEERRVRRQVKHIAKQLTTEFQGKHRGTRNVLAASVDAAFLQQARRHWPEQRQGISPSRQLRTGSDGAWRSPDGAGDPATRRVPINDMDTGSELPTLKYSGILTSQKLGALSVPL